MKPLLFVFLLLGSISAKAQHSFALESGVNWSGAFIKKSQTDSKRIFQSYFAFTPHFQLNKKWRLLPYIKGSFEGFNLVVDQSLFNSFSLPSNIRFVFLRFSPQVEYALNKNIGIYIAPDINLNITGSEPFPSNSSIPLQNPLSSIGFSTTIGSRIYLGKLFFHCSYTQDTSSQPFFITLIAPGDNLTILTSPLRLNTFQLGIGYVFQKRKKYTNQ